MRKINRNPRFSLRHAGDLLATLAYPGEPHETVYTIRVTPLLLTVERIEHQAPDGRCTMLWTRGWPERPHVPMRVLEDAEALIAAESCK